MKPPALHRGLGLVAMPAVAAIDPEAAVLVGCEVPEEKRFCWKCRRPVGRHDHHRRAAVQGTCRHCRTLFSFSPALRAGEVVAGQYEVKGPLAYGGTGWVFLARDRHVGGRWVVLKGLQNPRDIEAHVAALAERQFLSEVVHPAIVKIFNFVTHRGGDGVDCGYLVMEYIGGSSLGAMLERQAPQLLPVAEAIAYVLEILPALAYMHGIGLAYNDLKPDNIMVSQDEVKLIDLGAVAALGSGGELYGTPGYRAPEVARTGPTVASDIYTVGRTLAALTLPNWTEGSIVGAEPLLTRHPAFAKLLRRATDDDPAQRFPSATAMRRQLGGVLRLVLACDTGREHPQVSTTFTAPRTDFGVDLVLGAIDTASAGHRRVGLDAGELVTALPIPMIDSDDHSFEVLEVDWSTGVLALATGDLERAYARFDAVATMVPGELAPLLALAATAELLAASGVRGGRWNQLATGHYRTVWRTDRSVVAAAFGLARHQLADGDQTAAIETLRQVRSASQSYDAARMTLSLLLVSRPSAELTQADLDEAADSLAGLPRERRVLELTAVVVESALDWLGVGCRPAAPADTILGHPYTERGLRAGLESALRAIAFATTDNLARFALVDRANAVRPRTWW
ncbi:serine/threonine-protein kinase [Nocardia salmonicida]|uniref:serine/threonine-protein kinase n=1 Tax=Nocardia salmonicida TaxID=53431 RepID=UPI002E2C8C48|nr:tetratricopeptide repeat protein [Nocardia salmonicida]